MSNVNPDPNPASGHAQSPTGTTGSQGSHGSTIPFPHSVSADNVAGLIGAHTRSLTEGQEDAYDVHTHIESSDRFRTVVRTIIDRGRRARRRSEPGATRPTIDPDAIPMQERGDSGVVDEVNRGRGRGLGLNLGRSPGSGAAYPSIGDRLATGDVLREGKRVSFEGDESRGGLFARLYPTTSRTSDRSDPLPMSTAAAARIGRSPLSPGAGTSPPRNASPLRRWIRARRDPKDLYIARNPFHWKFEHMSLPHPHLPPDTVPLARAYCGFLIKQAYISLLLRLPSLYFSRVGRLFEEADLTKKEMERIIKCMHSPEWEFDLEIGEGGIMSQPLREFKDSWEEFVDHVIKEWKTLNLVSALLLTAILTLFQIEVSNEPVTHTCGLLSLVCALMSLVFGCMYIVRFQTMRTMNRAARWAQAAQASQTNPLWNVWIFLSIPSVFLAWALIMFICTILAYTWTSDPTVPPEYLSHNGAYVARSIVSALALLGVLALCGVISTFRSYSDSAPVPDMFGSPLANVNVSLLATPRSSSEAAVRTEEGPVGHGLMPSTSGGAATARATGKANVGAHENGTGYGHAGQ